eukprot:TRINITY_DN1273_c0_g1_i3.p1 TRINITY_DN1273_c0_g1~~TRINITY_DN1273_c0_g1_i3.p1  ORF type:complete len:122 (+),score=31.33 TRINITY_DN1273_c0_g1_i3:112-477(+)
MRVCAMCDINRKCEFLYLIMENIVKGVAEYKINDIIGSNPEVKDTSGINWNNFNFPPCLNLVHFSLSELRGSLKSFVLLIYFSYLITIAVMVINLLSTIVQVAKFSSGINIFYCFLSSLFP